MTQQHGDVDWELLADHLGGALAGTPDGDRVAELVTTDPHWASAAAELSTALDAVGADLRSLPAPTMPDDVTERLVSALHGLPPLATPETARHRAPAPAGSTGPPAGPAGESRRPPGRPGDRSRRRRRVAGWAAGLLAAVGAIGFVGLGLANWDLGSPDIAADSGGAADETTSHQEAPEAAAEPEAAAPAPRDTPVDVPLIALTGTDYQPPTLEQAAEPETPAGSPAIGDAEAEPQVTAPPPSVAIDTNDVPEQVPPGLDRLWADPQARGECLAAIAAALEPAPVTIDTVDFATFEGEGALVMWATADDGTRWAIAAGPDCGISGAGADERFRTRVQ